jgi:hypothetical protein
MSLLYFTISSNNLIVSHNFFMKAHYFDGAIRPNSMFAMMQKRRKSIFRIFHEPKLVLKGSADTDQCLSHKCYPLLDYLTWWKTVL